jgi:pimeloyl-ACP methyl ester carboxylesterase
MEGPAERALWMDIDWRAHQRWVIVDAQPVNTIELGDGPPLVFIHGLSGSWPNWLEQLPVFARAHRVMALDLPGFGRSPMPTSQISIPGYARLLDRLLDQLDIDTATVIGNSMGGLIAAQLAIAVPARVERLVLISPAGISTYGYPGRVRVVPTWRHVEPIVSLAAWIAARSDAVARRPRLREATLRLLVRHPDRLGAPLAAEQLRGAGKPGFMQALQSTLQCDLRGHLPEIACPALIVWGDSDRVISVRDADVFAELIPNSHEVIFEDTGHLAMLERPRAFNPLLEKFLGE